MQALPHETPEVQQLISPMSLFVKAALQQVDSALAGQQEAAAAVGAVSGHRGEGTARGAAPELL